MFHSGLSFRLILFMKWQILTIGKPALAFSKLGVAEYLKRLQRYTQLELKSIAKEAGREKNSRALLAASEGCFRIVMDERGKTPDTAAFAKKIQAWQMDGSIKKIAILIGGADGHSDEVREKADLLLSLSAFTLQHELALVVLLEQLYRVHTVLKGEPYHR